ncbi:hypothetical protein [Clostridium oryzae]|uniref:Uncharacterized protein n=1 Tax=Clostridium oryzae TaxID=1450648 RepID=A0A1V4IRC7_9CLOT|nr:hypothetical protein [Clostridium oryzae]OPJ62571.1 hypothetical protein CLORY_17010 [Clostridium oryzae]
MLSVIEKNPGVKAKDTPLLLNNRSIKTIENQIKELVSKGLIERKGSKRTGGYYVMNK